MRIADRLILVNILKTIIESNLWFESNHVIYCSFRAIPRLFPSRIEDFW